MSLLAARQQVLCRLALLAILAIAAVGLVTPPTQADDWLPISAEELKMTSDPKAPGAPAIKFVSPGGPRRSGLS